MESMVLGDGVAIDNVMLFVGGGKKIGGEMRGNELFYDNLVTLDQSSIIWLRDWFSSGDIT